MEIQKYQKKKINFETRDNLVNLACNKNEISKKSLKANYQFVFLLKLMKAFYCSKKKTLYL